MLELEMVKVGDRIRHRDYLGGLVCATAVVDFKPFPLPCCTHLICLSQFLKVVTF